jgi:hypothetical protein
MLKRPGFSLPDLLIGLVLFGLIGTMAVRYLLHTTQLAQRARERALFHTAAEAAVAFLRAELTDIGGRPGDPDLLVATPESLNYRATRGLGMACALAPGALILQPSADPGLLRSVEPGRDQVQLLVPGDSDRQWHTMPITAVAGSSCGGMAALRLSAPADSFLPGPSAGARWPARLHEAMQVRWYRSLGHLWFGVRSLGAGEPIQPMAGPFQRGVFRYLDRLDQPTSDPAQVRVIEIELQGEAGARAPAGDSLTFRITPWNLPL